MHRKRGHRFSGATVNPGRGVIDDYEALQQELARLLSGERDWLVNLANTAALLNLRLSGLNWVGFYLWRDGQLVLGPFQGKPACVRIAPGRGVCGAAADRRSTVIVPDVHQFPGHISCDTASASEIVIPLELPDRQIGVLDLDAPTLGRFDEHDRLGLEAIAGILLGSADWPQGMGRVAP
jgi:L-methionine (R)-S-oxide reductase